MSNVNILHGLLQRINNIQSALKEVAVDVENLLWAEEVSAQLDAEDRGEKRIYTEEHFRAHRPQFLATGTICEITNTEPNFLGATGDFAEIVYDGALSNYHKDSKIDPEPNNMYYRIKLISGKDKGSVTRRHCTHLSLRLTNSSQRPK